MEKRKLFGFELPDPIYSFFFFCISLKGQTESTKSLKVPG